MFYGSNRIGGGGLTPDILRLPNNDCDHPVAANDAVKCEKRTTATRRASHCSPLVSAGLAELKDGVHCIELARDEGQCAVFVFLQEEYEVIATRISVVSIG